MANNSVRGMCWNQLTSFRLKKRVWWFPRKYFKDLSGNVMSETGQAFELRTLHTVFIQALFYLPVDST